MLEKEDEVLLLFLLLLPDRCFVVGLAFVFDFDEDMVRSGRSVSGNTERKPLCVPVRIRRTYDEQHDDGPGQR